MFNWMKKKEEPKDRVFIIDCGTNCPRDEKKCPKWVVMYQHIKNEDGTTKDIADGRCAIAWIPVLLIELKQEISRGINHAATN